MYYLSDHFLDEIKQVGYNVSEVTTTYWNQSCPPPMGFIRKKGEHVTCPRGNENCVAFADCLKGKHNVGPSNGMLSYIWGESLWDIAKTLRQECLEEGRNPKRTYI